MIKLGIVMDPIANINIKKDSSFAMLLEATASWLRTSLYGDGRSVSDQWRSPRPYPHAERKQNYEEWFHSSVNRICRWPISM